MLEPGKKYRMPDGQIVECLSVCWSWAMVRSERKIQREFEINNGKVVTSLTPTGAYPIPSNSVIPEADDG